MKRNTRILVVLTIGITLLLCNDTVHAQQYKMRQVTGMTGMSFESTIYVKGPRKRTEEGGYQGMPPKPVRIEQCDKQRTVYLNDRKKLYFIEPFANENSDAVNNTIKPVKAGPVSNTAKSGGVIHNWYTITDTAERKKMYGFTARHIWTTQKIKPSADACMMKDSMLIKTDGWYIDLPEFNCSYGGYGNGGMGGYAQSGCQDKFVTHQSGKGKLGFPLIEKRTMIMGNGMARTSQFETNLETLEFSTAKPDSMLFEIPQGYSAAKNREELEEKFDVRAMVNPYSSKEDMPVKQTDPSAPKAAGITRIGVLLPKESNNLQAGALQEKIISTLTSGNFEAVAIASEDEAKQYHCDMVLSSEIVRMKQASKVGGLLRAIKNADPSAGTSFNVEANLTITNADGDNIRLQKNLNGKYSGNADEAAKKALEEGAAVLLRELN